jgi:hypothetical protein
MLGVITTRSSRTTLQLYNKYYLIKIAVKIYVTRTYVSYAY